MPLKDFLETVPVLEPRDVVVSIAKAQYGTQLNLPAIHHYCPVAECAGVRRFDSETEVVFHFNKDGNALTQSFVLYFCRNCRRGWKQYALEFRATAGKGIVQVEKIGEAPRFGEPRPDLVTNVLDDEIEFFDRGYRSEQEGLGIGAFAYYRRFVESHKDKIIAEIRKVAVSQGLSQTILDALDRAARVREFSAAVAEVKDAIPDSIKINGANPLTLLHDALSAGLHNEDDVDCLAIAQDIRLVLTGLAERTSELLKSNAEMAAAVTRLNQRKSGQKKP